MGIVGWIRAWWRRRWIPAREFEEYKTAVCSITDGERHQLRCDLENAKETIRKLTEGRVAAVQAVKDAQTEFLKTEFGPDLARIITTHGLVGCRLDALVEKMGLQASLCQMILNSEPPPE